MTKIITVLLLFIVISERSKAQDFHLSLYDAAPLFLNPSMTGVVDAQWRVHGHYKTQWKSVNFKPYTTALLSFDKPYKKWGFGGQVINYRAGIGNYNALQFLGSIAYTVPLDVNKYHNFTIGTQIGLTQKSLEYQLLTYNNQYTTDNGGGFNNGLPNNEAFSGQSFLMPDLNAGALYYYSRQQSRLNPFIGFSAFNLLTPKETFFTTSNSLSMRFYLHVGTRVNVTERLYFIPKVLIMRQKEFGEMTFATDMGYYLKSSELYVLAGLTYRNKDAAIIMLGARRANYIAKVSYDINTSTLSPASTGRGGFEISFTYMKLDPESRTEKICPKL